MKIVVLNGSPKGMVSVTMQYVLWLRKKFLTHEFTIQDVCHELRRLEDDERAFGEVLREVAAADGVLWAFPLYYLLVHAHYKRFIELLFKRGQSGVRGEVCRDPHDLDQVLRPYRARLCSWHRR